MLYVCYTYSMHFEWDNNKASLNLKKHGVTFREALSCFYDSRQIAFYDPDHSDDEHREILVGHSSQGRLLVVVYTIRDESVRIISVRPATKREVKVYEERI